MTARCNPPSTLHSALLKTRAGENPPLALYSNSNVDEGEKNSSMQTLKHVFLRLYGLCRTRVCDTSQPYSEHSPRNCPLVLLRYSAAACAPSLPGTPFLATDAPPLPPTTLTASCAVVVIRQCAALGPIQYQLNANTSETICNSRRSFAIPFLAMDAPPLSPTTLASSWAIAAIPQCALYVVFQSIIS